MHPESLTLDSRRNAVDAVGLGFLALLLLLLVLFPSTISDRQATVWSLSLAGGLYCVAAVITRQVGNAAFSTALHTAAVLALFSHFFEVAAGYHHVFVSGWMDAPLVEWEKSIVGFESSVALQAWVDPLLTEWMMFSYVAYVPLLPLLALICYRAGGSRAATDYLLNLSIAYGLCYLGFFVYPVAGPLFHYPEEFSVALRGGFFASCGEWIRTSMHYPGGSLPSPHCAAGTVMMTKLYRYRRDLFLFTLPVFLSIYAATVYGRYHYLSDSVSGIVVGILALRMSPVLIHAADRLAARLKGAPVRGTAEESVSQ